MNKQFEDLVKDVNWPVNPDINYHKGRIMAKYNAEEAEAIENYARELKGKLYSAMKAYEESHRDAFMSIGSDDGLEDALCHIVGQGEEYVNEVLDDPRMINDVYDDCTENFLYIFPDTLCGNDYDMLEIDYYHRAAARIMEALNRGDHDETTCGVVVSIACDLKAGRFHTNYSDTTLYNMSNAIGLGCYIGNIWKDGKNFYKGTSV